MTQRESYIKLLVRPRNGEWAGTPLTLVTLLTHTHSAPSLLVLDDLHVLCPHRNSAPSEGERRSTATLLTCLDSLGQTSRHVVVVATTNQIEGVEPSLRRPGRFDREIEIPAPNAAGRRDILIGHLSTIDHTLSEEEITSYVAERYECRCYFLCYLYRVADSAHGHVGADLLAVCVEGVPFVPFVPLVTARVDKGSRRMLTAIILFPYSEIFFVAQKFHRSS